jgi:beta-N-acetylhexosaminidase
MIRTMNSLSDALSLEACIGQLLCPLHGRDDLEAVKRWQEKEHYGCAFLNSSTLELFHKTTDAIQSAAEHSVIVAADLECGAKSITDRSTRFPWSMASGAARDEAATEIMGLATAMEGRHAGIHWTFAPVVDINYNFRNGVSNVRTYGDDPDTVLRCASAAIRGIQAENRMAACAKHFPGDGLDERDQHLLTTVNNLSVDAWMATYGKVWRGVIDAGVRTIMSGHISFPAWQGEFEHPENGLPATLCPKLQIELLRKELGFDGLIVSDAAPMIGLTSRVPEDEAAVQFIAAGGDVYLFARPGKEHALILKAVREGRLSEERVREAAGRVMALRQWLGLAESPRGPAPSPEQTQTFRDAAETIARKAITVQKDNGRIGQPPPKSARILTVTVDTDGHKFQPPTLEAFDRHLQKLGYADVTHWRNPGAHQMLEAVKAYDTLFLNLYILPHMHMGHTRLYSPQAMIFWRGFAAQHPDIRCTSFGSPYLLYDQPHLPNMLLAYCGVESCQRAAVEVWMGLRKPEGVCPVRQPRITILDQPEACV